MSKLIKFNTPLNKKLNDFLSSISFPLRQRHSTHKKRNKRHSKSLRDIHVTVPEGQNETKPVVLLFGWLGCQDKHLQKYSKIYEDRGMTTVRYTAPVHSLLVRRSKMLNIAEDVVKTIEDNKLLDRPLLVHTLSNGGAYCFRYIKSVLEQTNKSVTIKGHIFDSGMCRSTHFDIFYTLMKDVFMKDKIYSTPVASVTTLGYMMFRLSQLPFRAFTYVTKNPNHQFYLDPYYILKTEERKFPQLFLYSKEDHLMPYKDVENFAQERKQRGIDVDSHCFKGSDHVSHYLMFPELYVQLVDKFIEKCHNIN